MALKIVVLAKQVPDTRNVGKDAMTAEGTVNRAALPAIFNPEDLNALEQALRLKEQNPGSTVGILTMGPPRAGEIIRQGLYRGADTGWLLTDRLFAGADNLATSYALATAIKKIGDVDIVIGGRQAIDGDTAQVGPQVAQKLGLNQVTYAEEVLSVSYLVQAQLLSYLRTYLSGITIDSLTTTDNDIYVANLLDGSSQSVRGSEGIGTSKQTVGEQPTRIGTTIKSLTDDFTCTWRTHREDSYCRARILLLETKSLL